MLPSGILWATFASLVVGTSSSNNFVTSKFPSEFQQNETTEFYWENLDGYIAGIRVYSRGKDSDSNSDSEWILEPNCPDKDSDSSCTAYANNGSASFGGSLANGTQVALGSGYELVLLWTDSKSYDDIDDDTSEVTSPTFSIVPGKSGGEEGSGGAGSGMSKGETAGIAIAVILVVMFLVVVLWWRLTKERRRRRWSRKRQAEKDEEEGDDDRRWTPTAARKSWMGKGTQESWVAATDLPEKPRPTASRSLIRDMSKRAGRLYLDDKAELPSDPSPPHRIDTRGLATAGSTAAPAAPAAPVELPAEPPRGQHAAAWRRSGAAGATFVYDPEPPYALRSPPPCAEPAAVSPLSPTSAGAGAMGRRSLMDGSVSPLTPVSRKPVGGGMRAV